MGWVTFNVVEANSANQGDGQVEFTLGPNSTATTLKTGTTLQYARDSHPTPPPNPTTIFTTTSDVQINNTGVFDLPDVDPLPNNVNIPPAPGFGGGTYNALTDIVYNPTTKVLTGTFVDTGFRGLDDNCDWTATVTTPMPAGVKKAGY